MTQTPQAQWLQDTVAEAPDYARADFIRKTYAHLFFAIAMLVLIDLVIFMTVDTEALTATMLGSPISWLVVLGLFMAVGWLARWWANSETSPAVQYMGLTLYVIAEAIILVPLLHIAANYYPGAIMTAGVSTGVIFTGLTAFVFFTKADLSFMGGALAIAGLAAMALIVLSLLMGFSLGLPFVVVMIALAAGYVLYDTSNIIHHYRVGQHVAASLALFASVALLFWYVLRLVMALSEE